MNRTFDLIAPRLPSFSENEWNRWFLDLLRPCLASFNPLMLMNVTSFINCTNYRAVVKGLSHVYSTTPPERQRANAAVLLNFLKDSAGEFNTPACRKGIQNDAEFLEKNLGSFVEQATFTDLEAFNISITGAISQLRPSQLAQVLQSSGNINNTDTVRLVFDRLEQGDGFENVEVLLTELTKNAPNIVIESSARDLAMNRTFDLIAPRLPSFSENEWNRWFLDLLRPCLASFNPLMLMNVTSFINCTNYRAVVRGLSHVYSTTPPERQRANAAVLLNFLKDSAGEFNTPACRKGIQNDAEFLEKNLGSFVEQATFTDLKAFNVSIMEVLDRLTPQQKAELLVDPDTGALENETFIKVVCNTFLDSSDTDPLSQFIQAFFRQIPRNADCPSYTAIVNGLQQCFKLNLPESVKSSIGSLQMKFLRCRITGSLRCNNTAVNVSHICADVSGSQQIQSGGNLTEALCNISITAHACSSATHLTPSNVATLLNCSLQSQMTYSPEVWKLFIREASPVLDEALTMYSAMAPNTSSQSLTPILEAVGEVIIANFSQMQVQDDAFVKRWFETNLHPFLAASSPNFLFCLSSTNFSCQTYHTVIRAFSRVQPSMKRETQKSVLTHFIQPFLVKNDSSDPGCVSASSGTKEWLQDNFGSFSEFADLQDLQTLNPNFSVTDSISQLRPSQLAQVLQSSGNINNTDTVRLIFDRLEQADGFENVEVLLTELTDNAPNIVIESSARDLAMNRTFDLIAPRLPSFSENEWNRWFLDLLRPCLASFNPLMLMNVTSFINCTNYRAVVKGLSHVYSTTPPERQRANAAVLLNFLKDSAGEFNTPACRKGIQNDAEFLEKNLGSFVEQATFTDLEAFNISITGAISQLRPSQLAQVLQSSGNINNTDTVRLVFDRLEQGDGFENVEVLLTELTKNAPNIVIESSARDLAMNRTFDLIAPRLPSFSENEWNLWFLDLLRPCLASFNPLMLMNVTSFINCTNYRAVVKGLSHVYSTTPPERQRANAAVLLNFLKDSAGEFNTPACRKGIQNDAEFLEKNLGSFVEQATFTDLEAFNISITGAISQLRPSQLAQVLQSSGNINNTDTVRLVFDRLEQGDGFENVEVLLTELTKNAPNIVIESSARDLAMNRTFDLIAPRLPSFSENEWNRWFLDLLRPCLASFNPLMLMNVTSFINCTNYRAVVRGLSHVYSTTPPERQRANAAVLLNFLKDSAGEFNTPACRKGIQNDAEFLEKNLGSFVEQATFTDLKAFNVSIMEVLDRLTPQQKAELLVDPDTGALENETFIKVVCNTFLDSSDTDPLSQFIQAFFRQIPRNADCPSYTAIVNGLQQCFKLNLPESVKSSIGSLQMKFLRCRITGSLRCNNTAVNVSHICADVSGSQQIQSGGNLTEALCNISITAHACSSATHLTPSNVATLLNCSLQSQMTYSPEVWKLFIREASPVLDEALTMYSAMAPNTSSQSLTPILEAVGEVIIANFSQMQVQDDAFVKRWFETNLHPFLAASSPNFLFCLSSTNFSCQTYHTVIRAFSRVQPSMKRETQKSVLTHFIQPFLVKNDSSDPGCVSASSGTKEWLQDNFGSFSEFADLQDLQTLNPNFSVTDSISQLRPSQLAQVLQSSGNINNTDTVRLVFDRLEQADGFENVEVLLTELTDNAPNIVIESSARDLAMNRTFDLIAPRLPSFSENEWNRWFLDLLRPCLASFNPLMLMNVTSFINCTNYRAVVKGLSHVYSTTPPERQRANAAVLLNFLKDSAGEFNTPACRKGIQNDAEFLEKNLGSFVEQATFTDLEAFNISITGAISQLRPSQLAQVLQSSGNINNTDTVRLVFDRLEQGDGFENVEVLLTELTKNAPNIVIESSARDLAMNRTFDLIAPRLPSFSENEWNLWFLDLLRPCLASFNPLMLMNVTSFINCTNYRAVVKGLSHVYSTTPPERQRANAAVLLNFLKDSAGEFNTPACRKGIQNDAEFLEINLGSFVEQATFTDLEAFNISITGAISQLRPSQLAQVLQSPGNINNTDTVRLVFDRLEQGDGFENVEVLLTELTKNAPNIVIESSARDLAMNRTFDLIAPRLPSFSENEWNRWFLDLLRPCLASFNPLMLMNVTSFINCTNYRAVVKGLSHVYSTTPPERQRANAAVLLNFLKDSAGEFNTPACRKGIQNDAEFLEKNLGSFVEQATFTDLEAFNISITGAISQLRPSQLAQVLQSSGNINNTDTVRLVFDRLEQGNGFENVEVLLTELTKNAPNIVIESSARDLAMNRTFDLIAPRLPSFSENEWNRWFLDLLRPCLASFNPLMLMNVTSFINCTNYRACEGLSHVYSTTPPERQRANAAVLLNFLKDSASEFNTPACRKGIQNDAQFLEINLGSFVEQATFTELNAFNLSTEVVLQSLSPAKQAEFLLEPANLSNETVVTLVFTQLINSSDVAELGTFFSTFVGGISERNTTIDPKVRDIVLSMTLMALGPQLPMLRAQEVDIWFNKNLVLFLPSINVTTINLISKNISCASYQEIVKGFGSVDSHLSQNQTVLIFSFLKEYLMAQSSSGLSCVEGVNDSRRWLQRNFGPFRVHATYMDFVTLNRDFSGVEVADLLTLDQLAQLSTHPSRLNTAQHAEIIINSVRSADLGAFFDTVSPAIENDQANYSQDVKSTFLNAIFVRGNLSSPAISDTMVQFWLDHRLRPLLHNLRSSLVTPLFNIWNNRSCNSSEEMIGVLEKLHLTFSNATRREINRNIFLFLQGPMPLRCYTGGSFFVYLRNTFHSFGSPDVSMFISLLPQDRQSELICTISTSELRQFLSQPNVIGNSSDICIIFNNYNNTSAFLETEDVPDDVKMAILPCVWPLSLRSNSRSDVNLWFDVRLRNYLRFLNQRLISSGEVQNATCVAFQKLVLVMGTNFTYSGTDIEPRDVYNTIRSYLSNVSGVKCYNASDATLNSTAWFVNYIGTFVRFITLDDLNAFVNTSQIAVFVQNPANLQLFNNTAVPEDVIDFYISELYNINPTFNPVNLPGHLLCSADVPGSAFVSQNEADATLLLQKLNNFCNGSQNREVSAALASNFKEINANIIKVLGESSSGLSTGQLATVPSSVLVSALPTLGSANSWDQGQANTVIQKITSGGFKINSGSSLTSLGTLVMGISSDMMESIPSSELLNISHNANFVSNIEAAPPVVRETFVQKIISADPNPVMVVQNVPDMLAGEISPTLLAGLNNDVKTSELNQKQWTPDQAQMILPVISPDFDTEELSTPVLQGFTCTSVARKPKTRVRDLIHACRPRRGRPKVELKESQVTCMYNLISEDLSQNFTEYPSEMLLYFQSRNVERANCRSYFRAMGVADFSVVSDVTNVKRNLLDRARSCLDIRGFNMSREDVEIVGNMVCTLDSSYIENSDSSILEKLTTCPSLSDSQVAAVETQLLSGKTKYGNVNSWNTQTLEELGNLPLFFTGRIWAHIEKRRRRRFLRRFMPQLRKNNTSKAKLKRLFKDISVNRISKRGAGCTQGNITQVEVNDPSFPFGYDTTQFDLCLDIPVLKDNLDAMCDKVDDDELQKIILKKLNQAYPSGVSDENVQLLYSVSRVATIEDINKWNITKVDTLSALMNADDGPWDPVKSKTIIAKYLNTSGNSLNTTELNAINSNLCSLDVSTLKTITLNNLRNTKHLNIESCSLEKKKALFEIANVSFSPESGNPQVYYPLIQGYLGGASFSEILALSNQNISMDINTFQNLDPAVIAKMNVTTVRNLLGQHVSDLALFQNDTVIADWVNMQPQSDLDLLGLNLTKRVATSTPAPGNTTSDTTVATTPPTTDGNTTSSNTSVNTTGPLTGGNTTSSNTTVGTTGSSTVGGNTSSSSTTAVTTTPPAGGGNTSSSSTTAVTTTPPAGGGNTSSSSTTAVTTTPPAGGVTTGQSTTTTALATQASTTNSGTQPARHSPQSIVLTALLTAMLQRLHHFL
ncbi:uncharacterized protein LOC117531935 [Thalassophryne amazonica]|uniref:uncharacterized protein LOC117531935 n=1 Tax=Thalassophryne amazonica TaxID=390379 RepID=UPI001471E23E|nr:uncharacterized protein LOC117531935 [Thalassophryne amazonica]